MLMRALRVFGWAQVVVAGLALAILFTPVDQRRYGDRLQIALPLLAWGCEATRGAAAEYLLRFAGMFVVAHGSKRLLGEAEVNRRPSGGDHGFPSAHTSSAAIGASALVHDCIRGNAPAQAVVVIAAAFVGASRIESKAHDIWQVLAGGLLGWGADRVLRAESPARHRARLVLRQIGAILRAQGAAALRLAAGLARRAGGRLARRGIGIAGVVLAAVLTALLGLFPLRAGAEVELSFYGGLQGSPHGSIRQGGSAPQGVSWQGKSFEAPPYYGLRATWWRSATFGIGLEVNHAKVYAADPAALGFDRLEFTDGLNIVTANMWRRWPGALAKGRVTPYAGIGLGLAIPHVDIRPTGGAHTFGYQVTGPAAQAVAGLSWRMNDRWSLFGEYKATYSANRATLDSGGTLRTNIFTNALNLGVSWRF